MRILLLAALSAALIFAQDAKKATDKMAAKMDKMAARTADPIDINTATKPQLEALKGVGPKYAEAIIKGRPYARKDELVSKKVMPEATYNMVKDQIIAKQAVKK